MSPSRPTRVRYIVLGVLCAAAVIAYVHRGCLSVPKNTIGAELGISASGMDQVLSAFFLGYALFQIPAGWIGDRFGARLSLTLFMLVWSCAFGLVSLSQGFTALIVFQVVNGMAQAGIFPCCVKTFSQWFPASERALPNGLLGSFMSVGGALATFLTGLLLLHLRWESVVALLAFPGLVFALGFFLWFRDRPEQHAWVNEAERRWIEESSVETPGADPVPAAPHAERAGSGSFLSQMTFVCGQQFFRAAAYIFYTTQFPSFLQEARNVGQAESGFWTSMPLLGVVFGSLTGGILMDLIMRRTGSHALSRKGMGLLGVSGAGLFLTLAFFLEGTLPTMLCITASTFFSGLAGPAAYTVTIDLGGKHIATVFSVMNTAGNIGATFLPVVLGFLVRQTSWHYALLYVAILYAGAAFCWLLMGVPKKT